MSSSPRLSIIIPTIGRPDDLRKMFATLLKQTVLPHEFVLVNAGPMDLKALCEECLAGTDIELKYATSRPGTSLQRNIALDMARGDFYFLFDDDILLEPDYIERTMECFELDFSPPVGGVLSTFNNPSRKAGWRRKYFKLFGMTHSAEGSEAKLQSSGAVRWLIEPPEVVPIPVCSGGRVAYRAECFKEHRFDEFLPGYTMSEDVEISFRIAKEWTLVQTPHARMFHTHSPVSRNSYGERVSRLIYSRYYFFKKHSPKDLRHIAAFAWSNVGIVALYSGVAVARAEPGPKPVMKGIFKGYNRVVKDLTGRRDW